MRLARTALAALLLAPAARGDPFPSREGTSGVLDVPDARVLPLGGSDLGLELTIDHGAGPGVEVGPSPVALAIGLGHQLETGLALREGRMPGDPRPAPVLFTGVLKYQLPTGDSPLPELAVEARLDRANWEAFPGLRAIASSSLIPDWTFSGFLGVDAPGWRVAAAQPSAGLSASYRLSPSVRLDAEGLAFSRGLLLSGAARWFLSDRLGLMVCLGWRPWEHEALASVGVALGAMPPPKKPLPAEAAPPAGLSTATAPAAPLPYRDERPRFHLTIKPSPLGTEDGGRHLPYAPAQATDPRSGGSP